MSTAVVIPALPAHLQQYVAKHADENAAAAAGISAGSWPRISIGGAKFAIKEGGESTLICDPSNPDLPKMQLELVVVGHNPAISKTYYEGKWAEGDTDEPDCSSDDGVFPDSHVPRKQASACATCEQNKWGSKISDTGKQIKACSDAKRLVVLQGADLQGDAYELSIKPGSLKDWALYVKSLDAQRIPVSAVKTLVYFDPSVTYPKLLFKFGGFLSAEEIAIVEERKDGEDVKLIASPRRMGGNVPPTGTIPINPAPAPQPPAAAAPPAPTPAPAPAVVDPFAGTQPHVKPAVTAAGGLGTPGGDATYKALTGKDAPVAPAAPAAAPPPPTPKPVDPFEGQLPHVLPAVTAAGGLGTPGGDATYAALTGKPAPGAAAPAAPAKRSSRKATTPPPAQAPAAAPPPPATTPAAPATTFSQAPAQTAGAGGLDIEAMLANALKTTAPA